MMSDICEEGGDSGYEWSLLYNGGGSDDTADLYYNSSEHRQFILFFPQVYLIMLPQLHRL
jgi:hypothetical protein